jgi:hypothetical protein
MTDPSKNSRGAVNSIFGEELSAASIDERDGGSPDDDAGHERWLLDNVPPHHG